MSNHKVIINSIKYITVKITEYKNYALEIYHLSMCYQIMCSVYTYI